MIKTFGLDRFYKIKDAIITGIIFISLVSSVLLGFSYLFSNNDFIVQRNANAGQNYTCPAGNLAGNLCFINKIPVTYTNCQNGQAPALPGNICDGSYQNLLWPCSANVAGQVVIINGSGGGSACTFPSLTSHFQAVQCTGLTYNVNMLDLGDRFDNADRFTNILNARSTNKGDGPVLGTQFCLDTNGAAYNPCQAGFRVIFAFATDEYDPILYGPSVVWCGQISVLGGIGPNGETSPSTPLFFPAAGDSGSYIGDRRCGEPNAPGFTEVIRLRWGGNHSEYAFICSKTNYTAATQTIVNECPDTSWTPDPNNANICYKSAVATNFTVDTPTAVGTGTCAPNPVLGNSINTFNCTFPLTGSANGVYTLPAQGIFAGYWESGIFNDSVGIHQSSPCTISGATLICNSISAVNTSGVDYTRQVFVHIVNVSIDYRSSVVIQNSICTNGATDFPSCGVCPVGQSLYLGNCINNFVPANLPNVSINCDSPVLVNHIATCLITTPGNLYVTPTTKLRINDGNITTANCTMTNITTATCTNVSTGSAVGVQNVDIIYNPNETPIDTARDTVVYQEPNPGDISGQCIPDPSLINELVNCSGTITGDFLYINNPGVKISDGARQNCTITPSQTFNQYTFTCNNVSVGTVNGLQDVDFSYGFFSILEFVLDTITVNRNAGPQDYTLSCNPDTKLINEFFNCTGTVGPNIIDGNLQARISPVQPSQLPVTATSAFVNCVVSNGVITCDPIPTGIYPGAYTLTLKSDKITETLMDYLTVNKVAQASDLTFNCTPDVVVEGNTYNCLVTRSLNYLVDYLDFKTSTTGQTVRCNFANSTPTNCTGIPAGTILGIQDIIISNATISQTPIETVNVVAFAKQSNIDLSCTPDEQSINGTVNCIGTKLDPSSVITNPKVRINNGALTDCVITGVSISCPLVNVGSQIGLFDVLFVSDQNPISFAVDNVKVYSFATSADILMSCSPEIVVVFETTTCSGTLEDFKKVTNLKVKVNQEDYTDCVVDDQINYTITCNNVYVGGEEGFFDVFYIADQFSADVVFDEVKVLRYATEDDISMECSPQSILLNELINCVGTIPDLVYISNVNVKVGDNGNVNTCTVSDYRYITCPNVTTGSILGLNDIYARSDQFQFKKVDNLLIRSSNQVSGIDLICNPDSILVNGIVKCSGSINPNVDITNLKIFIDPVTQVPCTINSLDRTVTCTDLNVGPNSGVVSIYGKYDQDDEYIFIDDILVTRLARKSDLVMNCTPEYTLTNSPVFCFGTAPENALVRDFLIYMESNNTVFAVCTQDTEDFTISCEELDSGARTGLINVMGYEDDATLEDLQLIYDDEIYAESVIDKVQVFASVSSENISRIVCTPNPTAINTLVDCEIEIDGEFIDLNNVSIINEDSGDIIDCGVQNLNNSVFVGKIICAGMPSGVTSGFVNIGVRFNDEDEFVTKTQIEVLEEPNFVNVMMDCGEQVVKGGLIYCTGTVNRNVNLTSISLKSNLTDQIVSCSINNYKITCLPFTAPLVTTATEIEMLASFNGSDEYNGFDTLKLTDPIILTRTGSNPFTLLGAILSALIGFALLYYKLFQPKIKFNKSNLKL